MVRSSIQACPLQGSDPIFPVKACLIGRTTGISIQGRGRPISDWLAGGRADKRFGLGYVFLYFYGLERRFFVDTPAQDERRVLVAEVKRLLDVYRANRSVQRYFRAFLDAAQIVLEPVDEAEPRFEKSGYELPLELRVAIGQMAKEGQPLSADWLLGWYITHPETSLRTTMKRAFPECRALFTLLFDDQFPRRPEDTLT